MMMLTRWRQWIAVTSLATVLSSACASVPPRQSAPPAPAVKRTYLEARDAADALWADYSRRARVQTKITNGLYLWLSAIATAIVGLGVTGTSGNPITALALSGAYSYGAVTWFVRPEHLAVYKAGADGLRCIRDKSRPLGSADQYARTLEEAVKDGSALDKALAGIMAPFVALQSTPATGDDATTKAVALDAAREAETAARTVQKNARLLVRDLDDASDQMWSAVETVRTEVDFAIRQNTDPRDVLAHIQQNVLGTYRDLIALGEGQANKAAEAGVRLQSEGLSRRQRKVADDLQKKIEELNAAVATLVSETKHVSGLMEASSIPGVAEGIRQCLTAAQTGVDVPRIQVRPTAVALAPGRSETVVVIGTTHPVLQKLPSSAPFTTTTTVAEGTTSVTIKADDPAPEGEYVLSVTAPIANNDTVERTVRVIVTAAAPKPTAPVADVNKLLSDKGWTCGAGKRWTTGPAVGGGTVASIVCDDQAAADMMIKDPEHVKQIAALQKKFPKMMATAVSGKAQIVAPEATTDDAFITALAEALK